MERRILLLDDDRDSLRVLSRLMELQGYRVLGAANLSEARAIIDGGGVDVMVCDLQLPDGDACGLVHEVRGRGGPPAIALTGWGGPEDRQRALVSGFHAFLIKPVDLPTLTKAVENALSAPQQPAHA